MHYVKTDDVYDLDAASKPPSFIQTMDEWKRVTLFTFLRVKKHYGCESKKGKCILSTQTMIMLVI